MKRRAALALALCLTTIVGFFIVGYGMQIGFFGGGSGPGDAVAQADPTATPTQPPAAAPSEPQVIEEYVYRDVFVSNSDEGAASGASADPTGGTEERGVHGRGHGRLRLHVHGGLPIGTPDGDARPGRKRARRLDRGGRHRQGPRLPDGGRRRRGPGG